MTKCRACRGGTIGDGLDAVVCPVCKGTCLSADNAPERVQWTWERLRNFFARGGEIRAPTGEELIEYCRDPLTPRPLVHYRGDPKVAESPEVKKWLDQINHALMTDLPTVIGVDLAVGGSETWRISWDAEGRKLVYEKVDPADMVRRDLDGEGSPDNGSD